MHLNDLPVELLFIILSWGNLTYIKINRLVCTTWKALLAKEITNPLRHTCRNVVSQALKCGWKEVAIFALDRGVPFLESGTKFLIRNGWFDLLKRIKLDYGYSVNIYDQILFLVRYGYNRKADKLIHQYGINPTMLRHVVQYGNLEFLQRYEQYIGDGIELFQMAYNRADFASLDWLVARNPSIVSNPTLTIQLYRKLGEEQLHWWLANVGNFSKMSSLVIDMVNPEVRKLFFSNGGTWDGESIHRVIDVDKQLGYQLLKEAYTSGCNLGICGITMLFELLPESKPIVEDILRRGEISAEDLAYAAGRSNIQGVDLVIDLYPESQQVFSDILREAMCMDKLAILEHYEREYQFDITDPSIVDIAVRSGAQKITHMYFSRGIRIGIVSLINSSMHLEQFSEYIQYIDGLDNPETLQQLCCMGSGLLNRYLEYNPQADVSGLCPRCYVMNMQKNPESLPQIAKFEYLSCSRKATREAISRGCLPLLDWLLEQGDTFTIERYFSAAETGNLRSLRWLFKRVPLDMGCAFSIEFMLQTVVNHNRYNVLKYLLDSGCQTGRKTTDIYPTGGKSWAIALGKDVYHFSVHHDGTHAKLIKLAQSWKTRQSKQHALG
jgi:hypothetical protein